ncbi:MAG: hypothetical protein WDA20_07760 [Desulfuromonadales bacterium]
MVKVKTFGEPLEPFKTQRELNDLDRRVNDFIEHNRIGKVLSVSDSTTTRTDRPSV